MRLARSAALGALALATLTACPGGMVGSGSPDARVFDYTKISVETDSKAVMYNLIGRWFPVTEIERLDDDTMTPDAWCAREPSMLMVGMDEIEVQCDDGHPTAAAVARIERTPERAINIVLRAQENAKLKNITFHEALGSTAMISGSPCDPENGPVKYARFGKFEVLQRQILGGRRCAQIVKREAAEPE